MGDQDLSGYLTGDWTGLFPPGSIITLDHGGGFTEQVQIGAYIPGQGTSFSPITEEEYLHKVVDRWAQQYVDHYANEDNLDISC